MRTLAVSILLLGSLLTLAPAGAQTACQESFDLTGREDDKWYLNDAGAANPALTACPGKAITITTTQKGAHPHNIKVDVAGAPEGTAGTADDGDSETYTFTAPASGSGKYICEFHGEGMSGTINFAAGGATSPTGSNTPTGSATPTGTAPKTDDKKSPGFELVALAIALVGVALLVRRK